jgi:hypothetical protein
MIRTADKYLLVGMLFLQGRAPTDDINIPTNNDTQLKIEQKYTNSPTQKDMHPDVLVVEGMVYKSLSKLFYTHLYFIHTYTHSWSDNTDHSNCRLPNREDVKVKQASYESQNSLDSLLTKHNVPKHIPAITQVFVCPAER